MTFINIKSLTNYSFAIFICSLSLNAYSENNTTAPLLNDLLVTPPVTLKQFELADHNKKRFDKSRLEGKWTFLFFGYTHCPDVCPTTLTELDTVYSNLSALPELQQDTQIVFVSVDPYRDNAESIKQYLDYFPSPVLGVVSAVDKLEILTNQIGVKHRRLIGINEETGEKKLFVEHSAAILLIDPTARLVASFPPPHDSLQISRLYMQIRETGVRARITQE